MEIPARQLDGALPTVHAPKLRSGGLNATAMRRSPVANPDVWASGPRVR